VKSEDIMGAAIDRDSPNAEERGQADRDPAGREPAGCALPCFLYRTGRLPGGRRRCAGSLREVVPAVLLWLVAGLSASALVACAAGPQAAPETGDEKPPSWVLDPPEDTAESVYFTGSGTDHDGDVAAAEDIATNRVIAEITRYLGIEVTSDTTAEAEASLDSFQANVRQEVRQRGEARVEGLHTEDRYVEERNGRVTLHVLARYEREALEQERARLARLFQERVDAVEIPAAEARERAERYDIYGAIRKYIEAAAAAAGSDLRNRDIYVEENLRRAEELAESLSMRLEPATVVGDSGGFEDRFALEVFQEDAGEEIPVANVSVRATYPRRGTSGRTTMHSERLTTDGEGKVSFAPSTDVPIGQGTVTFAVDFTSALEQMRDVPADYRGAVDRIRSAVTALRERGTYEMRSAARTVPTAVAVAELDEEGDVLARSRTAGGIEQVLREHDFRLTGADLGDLDFSSVGREEVASAARRAADGRYERLIYGTARITQVDDRDGYIVRVDGEITVVDVETGEILSSESRFARSRGSSSSAAADSAFRSLGRGAAEHLLETLP